MTIADMRQKCKSLFGRLPQDVLIVGVLVLASSLSFALGYFAGQGSAKSASTAIENEELPAVPTSQMGSATVQTGNIVASKNGTKYYLSTCAGASRISAANKVWFSSAAAAQSAGYTPAANCKGL